MKKFAMLAVLLFSVIGSTFAQEEEDYAPAKFKRKVFNHVAVNVGAGTEGISVGVAAPLTNFFEFEAGVNIMPAFKISDDLDVNINTSSLPAIPNVSYPTSAKIDATGDFSRTTFNVKANVYPFGGNSKFFVAAGLSFGGEKLGKVSGSSEELRNFAQQHPAIKDALLAAVGANLGGYNLKLNDDFSINGDIRCNKVRPYLGLGFGRLVPKNRLGLRFELGCQFMGSLKVYQDGEELKLDEILKDSGNDDLSDIIDKINVYPVLKLSLVGRIL